MRWWKWWLKKVLWEALSHFNVGLVAVLSLFQALDIPPCKYTEEGYRLQDLLSVDVAQHKSKYQEDLKRSEALEEKHDQKKQNEGGNYHPGGLWAALFMVVGAVKLLYRQWFFV